MDKRLFLPAVWWTDAYAARRTRCNVPDELTFQSKPQLAAAMLEAMAHEGLLPFKYIVADCLYGNSPTCYVNLQEKRKTLPLSGPSHRLVPFSLSTDPRIRTSHQ